MYNITDGVDHGQAINHAIKTTIKIECILQ